MEQRIKRMVSEMVDQHPKKIHGNIGKRHSKESKDRLSLASSGEKNYFWNGGVHKDKGNYVLIHSPSHPFKDGHNYMREHRLVMEKWLRKNNPNHPALVEIDGEVYLNPKWAVHHKNWKSDDNRIENLGLMTKEEHSSYHSVGKNNGFYGRHHSKETRRKMRENHADFRGEKHPQYGMKSNQPQDSLTGRFISKKG